MLGHALFSVGVAVGLRKVELLGLSWEDVELEAELLRVRRTIQGVNGAGLVTGPPKSVRSRRRRSVAAYAVRVLREHRTRRAEERLTLGPYWQDSGLVFSSTIGAVIKPQNLTRVFDKLIKNAGVGRIRIYDYPDIRVMPTSA